MASAMLRGVSKYSLVHYWSLEVCQPLRRESCSTPRELTGREGKRGELAQKEVWERKYIFLLVLLLSFVHLQVLLSLIRTRTRCCCALKLILVQNFSLWHFLLPHLIGAHEIWIGRIKPIERQTYDRCLRVCLWILKVGRVCLWWSWHVIRFSVVNQEAHVSHCKRWACAAVY